MQCMKAGSSTFSTRFSTGFGGKWACPARFSTVMHVRFAQSSYILHRPGFVFVPQNPNPVCFMTAMGLLSSYFCLFSPKSALPGAFLWKISPVRPALPGAVCFESISKPCMRFIHFVSGKLRSVLTVYNPQIRRAAFHQNMRKEGSALSESGATSPAISR